jgi:hypothetical protein
MMKMNPRKVNPTADIMTHLWKVKNTSLLQIFLGDSSPLKYLREEELLQSVGATVEGHC